MDRIEQINPERRANQPLQADSETSLSSFEFWLH
jgi:hypothetical protein